jgi:hypothetical protein
MIRAEALEYEIGFWKWGERKRNLGSAHFLGNSIPK